jgi:hypothetical protein
MGTAWAEGASPMETVMHLFTLISTIIPTVNTLMEMGTIIKEMHTKATQKANAAKVAEIATVGVETGAKWGLTTANLAVLASNPWTIALVAVALALIGAMIISIGKQRE